MIPFKVALYNVQRIAATIISILYQIPRNVFPLNVFSRRPITCLDRSVLNIENEVYVIYLEYNPLVLRVRVRVRKVVFSNLYLKGDFP